MLESAWLFVGTIAFLWTVVTLYATGMMVPAGRSDDALALIGGVVGFVLWGVWTFGTLEIEVVADTTTYTFTDPALTLLGVAMSLVPAYIALTGPFELVGRFRDVGMDDL